MADARQREDEDGSDSSTRGTEIMLRTAYFLIIESLPDEQLGKLLELQKLNGLDVGDAYAEEQEDAGEMEDARQNEDEDSAPRVNTTDTIMLRTAYFVFIESLRENKFEKLLELQSLNGVDMGDAMTSDSESQITLFRDAFSETMLDGMARYIKKMPCVSWVTDRVIVDGRIAEITSLVTVVPEAPSEALIQSFVISAPDVWWEIEGTSLADDWVKAAARFGITDARKLAAMYTDSQFQPLDVPSEFLKKLSDSSPDSEGPSAKPCVPCLWDDTDLLTLTDGSAGAEAGCAWVKKTLKSVCDITELYCRSRGPEEYRFICEDDELSFRELQLFSEFRFALRAARVLEKLIDNIAEITDALEEELKRSYNHQSTITQLKENLRLLTGSDRTFRIRLAALLDLYGALGRTIKSLQSLQVLPWERQERLAELRDELKLMVDGLPSQSSSASGTESQRKHDPSDMKERWPAFCKYRGKISSEQVSEVAAFSAALVCHFTARLGAVTGDSSKCPANALVVRAMGDVRAVADLEQLKRSQSSDIVSSVDSAIQRLVACGLIPEAIPLRNLEVAYKAIRALKGHPSSQDILKDLWKVADDGQPELWPFLHLVVRLWLICPAENVSGDMASVVKEVFSDRREQLPRSSASKEMIIRWNGPAICYADGLISRVQEEHGSKFTR